MNILGIDMSMQSKDEGIVQIKKDIHICMPFFAMLHFCIYDLATYAGCYTF